MKTSKEFERFYEFKLKPRLEELEEKRKAIKSIHNFKTYGRILLILLVLIIIDVVLVKKGFLPEFMFAFVFISVVFALVYPFVVLYYKGANFIPINEEYKQTVIKDLVNFVDENLKYDAKKGITEEEFNNTKLFPKATSFKSEDLIIGEVNGISFRMADVKARRGQNKNTETLFEGLYIIATYNVDFGLPIYIRFKNLSNIFANKILDFLGEGSTAMNNIKEAHGISLLTGNSYFDSLFNVKGESEESMRKILTTNVVNSILGIKEKLFGETKNLLISPLNIFIKGNEVHLALFELDVFDLNALNSITGNNYTQKYFNILSLAIGLAEIFNSNFANLEELKAD